MKRLQKSTTDKKLFGVCGGVAEYFDVDPVLVRAGLACLTLATSFPGILLYLGLALAMPKAEMMPEKQF